MTIQEIDPVDRKPYILEATGEHLQTMFSNLADGIDSENSAGIGPEITSNGFGYSV